MTHDEILQLDAALDTEEGLSSREMDFIDNLDRNYRNQPLTKPQEDWLKGIAERIS